MFVNSRSWGGLTFPSLEAWYNCAWNFSVFLNGNKCIFRHKYLCHSEKYVNFLTLSLTSDNNILPNSAFTKVDFTGKAVAAICIATNVLGKFYVLNNSVSIIFTRFWFLTVFSICGLCYGEQINFYPLRPQLNAIWTPRLGCFDSITYLN